MEFEVLGWPEAEPRLALDHERFSYAGKFVMTSTGKAVLWADDADDRWGESGPSASVGDRDDSDAVLAAVAFNEDRTDDATLWLRYVTVRNDSRGEGLGTRLLDLIGDVADQRGYERVRIAVNNPFAYEAAWKAGHAWTGDHTGIAELVMERPRAAALADADAVERYREGLRAFRERDQLGDRERTFVDGRIDATPPSPVGRGDWDDA
jgi:GNAT superfamily N-acetyltransferase